MFRKLMLAALLAAGTLGGVTVETNTASAQPPVGIERHDNHRVRYQVLIRHRGHWDLYRTFRDRDDAYRVARYLEHRGFDAKVERVRGW